MQNKSIMAAMTGLIIVASCPADPIVEATYTKFFDRAAAILPRPHNAARFMYHSRCVQFKPYIKPGHNMLGMHTACAGNSPAAYLRGSVIMVSGERIAIDSGTNWRWNRAIVSADWYTADYDDSKWLRIFNHDEIPREFNFGYDYKGANADDGIH